MGLPASFQEHLCLFLLPGHPEPSQAPVQRGGQLCEAVLPVAEQQQGREVVKGLQTCAQGSGVPLEQAVDQTVSCGGLPGLALVLLSCKGILCNFAANCSSIWGLSGESAAPFQGILEKVWRGADLREPEICTEKSQQKL